jgi:hypothetical protein
MPPTHHHDHYLITKVLLRDMKTQPVSEDEESALLWPFINQQNLSKPKSFLIYLNARGRSPPCNFILTEMEFSDNGQVHSHHVDVSALTIYFSRDLNPHTYGRVSTPGQVDSDCASVDGVHCRLISGLQLLQVQEGILKFLVTCCKLILHDMAEDAMMLTPIQAEPPSSELQIHINVGHKSFSDAVVIAPYRNRGIIEIDRLQQYTGAAYNDAKDHVWMLREDPGYLAETILDISNHKPEQCRDIRNRVHPSLDTPAHLNRVLKDVTIEANTILFTWYETDRGIRELGNTLSKAVSRTEEVDAVLKFQDIAREACRILLALFKSSCSGMPTMRDRFVRVETEQGSHVRLCCGRCFRSPNEAMMFNLIKERFSNDLEAIQDPRMLYSTMDQFDTLARDDKVAKKLLTSRLSSLITQLSIIAECLFQIELWKGTPDIAPLINEHEANSRCDCASSSKNQTHEDVHPKHGNDTNPTHYKKHNPTAETTKLSAFLDWVMAMAPCAIPNHLVQDINPARGRLEYPADKHRTFCNVATMRKSEERTDRFWRSIDASYQRITGIAQHEVLRACLIQGGHMHRTPPWADREEPRPARANAAYEPISELLHDVSLQITGTFDRTSTCAKVKSKTRGLDTGSPTGPSPSTIQGVEDVPAEPNECHAVDRRTLRVFNTLFYSPTASAGELPRAVKWDEFKRAMARVGFSVEKLQGSAWQFNPNVEHGLKRSIQFHEPHPDSDIPYYMARRFGRRFKRVYGWSLETFRLA